jgi:hypothetical protein
MSKKEGLQNNNGNSLVEIMALFIDGRIKRENMSEENQVLIDVYMGIMLDDPKFAAAVDERRKQFTPVPIEGQRTSLFPSEVIEKMSKKKKKRKAEERGVQPSLWQESQIPQNGENEFESRIDPLDRVMEAGRKLNSRFGKSESFFSEEIKNKKESLRNEIGLPIARGKDPHVKDYFYKFLVRKICTYDSFGIFGENNRTLTQRDEELNMKISEVKGLVGELLNNKSLGRQEKFGMYSQFSEEYKNKWEDR